MELKKIYCIVLIAFCFACESNEITIDEDNLLLGNWISPTYDGEITSFVRGANLPDEGYGISFKANGELVERTSGFCGTPPLTFFNEEGTFTIENDLINISKSGYPAFFGWKIVTLTTDKLVVKRELSEQEKDHQELMQLFDEISNLVYSVACSNPNDWSFVAFGAKACGGPQGYLPYNKSLNVTDLFEKIEAYTNAEKEFNTKWNVASDCALVNPPKSVECHFEYPVLKY